MDNQKMGIYIAAKRKERQMTQTDLAQQLHITRQAVSKWESGKSVPDPETLLAMAALFQVTVEEILGGEDVPTDPPVPLEVPSDYPSRDRLAVLDTGDSGGCLFGTASHSASRLSQLHRL